jgi:hypothetical protein
MRFGAVHIIESLPPGELRTGERLLDELQPLGFTLQPSIETLFWRELNRNDFLNRFAAILEHLRESRRAPVIHIETHGHFDATGKPVGFELASGEIVTWADLKPVLTHINVTCCVNLTVVAGACGGAALAAVVQPSDRAPVWGVLGPTRVVSAGELEDGHLAFYRTLYSTRDFGPAIQALNDSVRAGDRPFVLLSAEWMFREIMRGYFRRYCTDEAIAARVQKAAPREEALRRQGVAEEEILARRERFREFLRDPRRHFDELKPHFFAADVCPRNAVRFSVTFEDCAPTLPAPGQNSDATR